MADRQITRGGGRPKWPDFVQRNFRIAELGRIFRSRYCGEPLPDDDSGWGDLKELLLAHASSKRCTREHLQKIASDWAPHFSGGTGKLIDEVLATPLRYRRRKAETVGQSLYLRFEERERLGIRTIRPSTRPRTRSRRSGERARPNGRWLSAGPKGP